MKLINLMGYRRRAKHNIFLKTKIQRDYLFDSSLFGFKYSIVWF